MLSIKFQPVTRQFRPQVRLVPVNPGAPDFNGPIEVRHETCSASVRRDGRVPRGAVRTCLTGSALARP